MEAARSPEIVGIRFRIQYRGVAEGSHESPVRVGSGPFGNRTYHENKPSSLPPYHLHSA
jgi:hypothetical protein